VPADHNLLHDEALERAHLLTDPRYEVTLDLTGDEHTFRSVTLVRFDCAEEGADSFVDLAARTVNAARLNGADVSSEAIEPGRIHLRGLTRSNVLEVDADCDYERTGVGLHRFRDPVDGNVYVHTQFEPFDTHRVFACFDQPDLKGRFTFGVRAPRDWEVVSNTPVVRREAAGEAVEWRFAETLPMPPYITALVAGAFHHVHERHGELDLGLYCRRSLAPHLEATEMFEVTRQGLDYFEQAFAYPYAFGKYDQLFVPEFNWGAMENAGCVTFSETYLFRSKVTDAARQSRASTILHELAHMWFGNLVTMRWWDDLWLNESFATYMGHRALADATRFEDSWATFATSIKAWALGQDQLPSTHPIVSATPDTQTVRTNFDGITYAKGASVLKQLVAWVGDDAFFSGLRDYFQRHAFANASLADFLAPLEKRSRRTLADWSSEWLETAGVATVRPRIEVDERGRITAAAIVQEAPVDHPTLRSHRLAIGCYELTEGKLRLERRLELDVTGARTEVPELIGKPRPDLLLPNEDDLAFAKVRFDSHSLDTLVGHLSALPSKLSRALAWGPAWDMTRDAELATSRWVELVAQHAAHEDDLTLLQSLLVRTQLAVDLYAAPVNRATARARLAAAARAALEDCLPGSDRQLAWVRHLVYVGDGDEHRLLLLELLDGSRGIAGLDMDTELRWTLLGRLARDGAAGEDRIAAELERDPTDIGVRHAAAASASRPAPSAKSRAFEALAFDRELPLATLVSIAGGLWSPAQDALLLPYVDRLPEAVESAWRDRLVEESISLTKAVYPQSVVDDRVVRMADRVLAGELPGPARRILQESRDRTLRALRARATDAAAPVSPRTRT
jgi:aminopeptidase N